MSKYTDLCGQKINADWACPHLTCSLQSRHVVRTDESKESKLPL